MDEIFVFAALIALFCVVVVPVLAIMALNRSARNETELHRLRDRIETLEARLAAASAPPGVETAPVATPAPEPAPVFVAPEPEPVPETAAAREPEHEPVPQPTADAPPVWSQAVPNAANARAQAHKPRRSPLKQKQPHPH
ncbi:hypothetical protein ACQPT8_19425 [Cronobacter sakazakii]|uniref:hypothetical protein n=1 Tax=Cronobacter sakazakii TaxID=28141 RepID=UPI003D076B85